MPVTHNFPAHRLASRAAAFALLVASLVPWAYAADGAKAPASTLDEDRRNCELGKTAQDKATCLREAGAAAQERRRGGLVNDGSTKANALERCQELPADQRADCVARIKGPEKPSQTVTTSGSVAGGGTITETRTVTVGKPVVVPASAVSKP